MQLRQVKVKRFEMLFILSFKVLFNIKINKLQNKMLAFHIE